MKRMIHCLCFVSFLTAMPDLVRAQDGGLDPERLMEVEYMAQLGPNEMMYHSREEMGAEAYDALKWELEEKDREKEDYIRNTPGITPYLFFLMERKYANRSAGFVPIMVAISKRKDVTEADLEKVIGRMEQILKTPADDTNQSREAMFLMGGVIILKNFPSAGNEDLAIRVLTRTDHYSWLAGKQHAARTLAVIGTERSLPYLESTRKWTEANLDHGEHWKDVPAEMETYRRNLQRRLEAGGHGRLAGGRGDRSKAGHHDSQSEAADGKFMTGGRWLLVVLGGVGLVVVAAYLGRRGFGAGG